MRSRARVMKAVTIIGFVFGAAAMLGACSIATDEEARGLSGAPGGNTPGNGATGNGGPSTGGPSTGGTGSPGADGGGAVNPGIDGGKTGTDAGSPEQVFPPGAPGCGLPSAAFCETFNQPAGTGNRSGDLGQIWGVSRALGYVGNWATTPMDQCGQTVTVNLTNDIKICNGHMVEASNDDTSVSNLAMYVKRPFDIAGRTGTFVFDVSDDSHGAHRAWPELWYTDKPVPTPFVHQTSWNAVPKDGFGFELSGYCVANQGCGGCPGVEPFDRIGFGYAKVVRNYVRDEIGMAFADSRTTLHGCVKAASGPTEMNHFEAKISQNQVEIFGTDPGSTVLQKLVTLSNVNLTLTRGFVWIQDAHYNGNKDGPDQGMHTFAWDNVGFDGPVLPADLAFDVLDEATPSGATPNNGYPLVKLGWTVPASTPKVLTVNGVNGIDNATAGIITLNFSSDAGATLTYSLNGNPPHTQPWVFPDMDGSAWRTIAVPIPLSEVVPGTNTISLAASGSSNVTFANVDLILLGAAGVQ